MRVAKAILCRARSVWTRSREEGQITVEYAILASVTIFTVMAAILAVRAAVIHFYYDVVCVICLPFP